jgi:catechol 2,3-dioxygenase-like lactoylglutathione lyase family enzyme
MKIQFVAGFGPVVGDPAASRSWWSALGLNLHENAPDYWGLDDLGGVNAFALWPLDQAAQNTFGTPDWPAETPIPQAWIELDVGSAEEVADAQKELESKGHRLLRATATEEWGQTTARLLSPEGLLVGITFTPWMHEQPKSD